MRSGPGTAPPVAFSAGPLQRAPHVPCNQPDLRGIRMAASLEELFARYQGRGDVGALGEVFDRTAPALLRIALHLAPRHDAEDAVQATYLRAIEVAATWDPERPLSPWLLGILGNRVRHLRTRGRRQPDPERLAPSADAPDPLAAAQCSELDEAVAATIAELPERYRPVLRLHLLDGRQPAEIAAALAVRPATVRSRLLRGLRALRRLLPPGFAAARAPSLAALPGMRALVLARGGGTAAAPVAATAAATGFLGGLVMQKALVIAALGAALAVWLVWGGGADGPPGAAAPAGAGDVVAGAGQRPVASTTGAGDAPPGGGAGDPAPVRVALDAVAPGGTGGLLVQATWSDGTPAAGVPMFVRTYRRGERTFARWQAATGADGVARFADLPAGEVEVDSGRTPYAAHGLVDIGPGATASLELVLAGVTVRGVVVDAGGRAVAGARIVVDAGTARELAPSAPDGTFELRGIEPDVRIGARAAGHAPSVLHPVPPARDGRTGELRLVLPGPGGLLSCAVVDDAGRPLADAVVSVGAGHWPRQEGAPQVAMWEATTDAGGRASFDGLPHGGQDVLAWGAGRAPWRGSARIAAETAELRIVLQPGAVLAGHVRDAAGNPLPGYQVLVGRSRSAAYEAFGRYAFQFTHADAAGSYRIEGLPPGAIAARCSGPGTGAQAELVAGTGEEVRWDPVLDVQGIVPGRVLGPDGRGMCCIVEGGSRDRRGWHVAASTDDDGRFALKNAERGLRVQLDVRVRYFPLLRYDGPLPAEGELLLRVPEEAMPSVRLRGRVVDADDRPVPMAQVAILRTDHGGSPVFRTDDEGCFEVGPFPPDEYRLFVEAEGFARRITPRVTVAAGALHDFGTVRLEPGCSVEVQLYADCELPEELHLAVHHPDGSRRGHVGIRDGRGSLANLEAGRYELIVSNWGLALACHPFEVAAGGTAKLHVTARRGVPTTVRLCSTAALPRVLRLEVHAAEGFRLLSHDVRLDGDGKVSLGRFALLPGAYVARVLLEGRPIGGCSFTAFGESCAVEVPVDPR